MCFLEGKSLSSKGLLASITYFDVIAGLVLVLVSSCVTFAVAGRPDWLWNARDPFGLGLFLSTILVFVLLRRRVSVQTMPWLRACIAVLTIVLGVILCRHWQGLWVVVSIAILLFALCLRSRTLSEGLERRDIFWVVVVVGGLFFIALLAEGISRFVPNLLPEDTQARLQLQAAIDEPWYVAHPYIGHLHSTAYLRQAMARSGASTARFWKEPARFDAHGFRNAEPWPERVDILTVGDSLTYSLTVKDEQAWPMLLERALPPHRVLNLGLVGAAPQQYLRTYETFGVQLSPKVLLVGLFLGNDLTDALAFDTWWNAERYTGFIDFLLHRGRTGINRWLQASYFYTALNDLRASSRVEPALRGKTVQLPNGSRIQLVPRLLARQAPFSSVEQPAFTLILHTLEHLCTLAARTQTHCLVLIFPDKEGVYLPVSGIAAANLAAPLLPELDKRGIAYLDFGPHFRQRARAGEALFWEVDVHPNAQGYAVIAEVVLAYLQEQATRYGLN